jgi:hypothetical protein
VFYDYGRGLQWFGRLRAISSMSPDHHDGLAEKRAVAIGRFGDGSNLSFRQSREGLDLDRDSISRKRTLPGPNYAAIHEDGRVQPILKGM